ncbi:MAG TPA: alpha/beta fold hydrolase [Gemmatimonadaceae bacterium]|nr:alpha/beta fold hydrolase [Gemmatimonadaceae bacterium]
MRNALLAVLFLTTVAQAQRGGPRPGVTEGDFIMKDFKFNDGSVLPELKIHYATLGRPRKEADGKVHNAVIILHGTTGSFNGFLGATYGGLLFNKGQLLDTATHFIILPDGIGTGKSSKPSDGLHAKFPKYGYEDMVRAQYRLVTEGLNVNHLLLVMGTSMGCMHSWMWAENWPDMMDGIAPMACIPTQIAGRNRIMREFIANAIRSDPAWMNGDYTSPPVWGLRAATEMLFMMQSVPMQQAKQYPTRDAAEKFADDYIERQTHTLDANDFLYQFEASRDYDPSGKLESVKVPVLAVNSADDQVNPPEQGLMEKLMPRVQHGRYVLIPISDQTRGHGTHSLPAVWGSYLGELLKQIEPKK